MCIFCSSILILRKMQVYLINELTLDRKLHILFIRRQKTKPEKQKRIFKTFLILDHMSPKFQYSCMQNLRQFLPISLFEGSLIQNNIQLQMCIRNVQMYLLMLAIDLTRLLSWIQTPTSLLLIHLVEILLGSLHNCFSCPGNASASIASTELQKLIQPPPNIKFMVSLFLILTQHIIIIIMIITTDFSV